MYFDRLKTLYTKNKYHVLPIKSGMVLELHENVWEWDTKRVQKFKWLVIEVKKPKSADGMFTIRWQVAGMTVEKIYPLSFPKFEKVILLDMYRTRQSKIFFMRDKIGKGAKLKSIISAEEKDTDLLQAAFAAMPVQEAVKEDKTETAPVAEDTTPEASESVQNETVAKAPEEKKDDTPVEEKKDASENKDEKEQENSKVKDTKTDDKADTETTEEKKDA